MKMNYLSGFLMASVLILIIFGVFAEHGYARPHRDIWLKNELGNKILPSRNSHEPYSPRKTCGTCHGYSVITAGYHFMQGFSEISDTYDKLKPWIVSPGMYGKW
ncbi:hypothetical protein JXJ21_13645 [candidate division KSB1 bacterium]|nr:hypothetical protein [candidate division KSB1 bacterium]